MYEFQIFISEAHIVGPEPPHHKPLGIILQESELILANQVEIALQDQKTYYDLKLGEILVLRGWLKKETADFFAEHWYPLLREKQKKRIGYYLRQAGLLDEQKIQEILTEQTRLGIRFGSVAVLRGWLKDKTLDFFLRYLYPQEHKQTLWLPKKDTAEHQTNTKIPSEKQKVPTPPTQTTKIEKETDLEILLHSLDAEEFKTVNSHDSGKGEDGDSIKWIG
jgi:hypothetical protein